MRAAGQFVTWLNPWYIHDGRVDYPICRAYRPLPSVLRKLPLAGCLIRVRAQAEGLLHVIPNALWSRRFRPMPHSFLNGASLD
jgi:hypothetical protein